MAAIGSVAANVDFPKAEEEVLKLWKSLDAFQVRPPNPRLRCRKGTARVSGEEGRAGTPTAPPARRPR